MGKKGEEECSTNLYITLRGAGTKKKSAGSTQSVLLGKKGRGGRARPFLPNAQDKGRYYRGATQRTIPPINRMKKKKRKERSAYASHGKGGSDGAVAD